MKTPLRYLSCIPTVFEPRLPYEDVVVQRWWSLPSGATLPLTDGGACRLIFSGRAGGSVGPDIRDAVLRFPAQDEDRVGDVEFHVRTSDWVAHKHHSDPRYNNVMLHVVLVCDDPAPTLRQDRYRVPTCSLYDIPIAASESASVEQRDAWPCHAVMRDLSEPERGGLLYRAGLLRFEQKTHTFVEQLHMLANDGRDAAEVYNQCLLPALAEALAYGRDRAFFRAAGTRLLGQEQSVPEPLGRAPAPSPLDAQRLKVLRKLLLTEGNVWGSLRRFLSCSEDEHLKLHAFFRALGLSLARTDILICNVVFPFAAAVALLEKDKVLGERVQRLYETHPGLPSNMITRMMSSQLQLSAEPCGSCQQQGLHYIYQQTCQAKRCATCIMGRKIL